MQYIRTSRISFGFFNLIIKLHREGSATNRATPSTMVSLPVAYSTVGPLSAHTGVVVLVHQQLGLIWIRLVREASRKKSSLSFIVKQVYMCTAVLCYSCTVVRFTVVQFYCVTVIQLYNFTVVTCRSAQCRWSPGSCKMRWCRWWSRRSTGGSPWGAGRASCRGSG